MELLEILEQEKMSGVTRFAFSWAVQVSMRETLTNSWDSLQKLAESWSGLEALFSHLEKKDGKIFNTVRASMSLLMRSRRDSQERWFSKHGEREAVIKAYAVEEAKELEAQERKLWKPRKSQWR